MIIKAAVIVAVTVMATPVFADPNIGTVQVCRLPVEHHKEFAKIPKGSTFIQSFPRKVFQPAEGRLPSRYVPGNATGYVVKTLDDAKVAPAPACTTIRVAIVPQPPGVPLARDVPPLGKGSVLLQQFNDPATIAQFKTEVIDGFK